MSKMFQLGVIAAVYMLKEKADREFQDAEFSTGCESYGEARMLRESARGYIAAVKYLEHNLEKMTVDADYTNSLFEEANRLWGDVPGE